MTRQSGWHTHRLRVRYAETDQMGVVYHGNYLTWFEIGRTEFIRDRGLAYKQAEELGLRMPVVDVHARYHAPAKYDDLVEIHTRIKDVGAVRMLFEYEVRLADDPKTLLATGESEHVWVDGDWKPVRIAKAAPDIHRMLLAMTEEVG
ncbi:acyl-CoA thioesterase [Paenibacillus thermotolerans]|uniref:acyl-CoA thioesterase n=1 Tax=Paenibacillus thermotolerans TaxID=3027807 RepID=UPI002367D7F6|nr:MULTISPECIES: thioesterase family protein [unclassified Paenibacillus]